MWLLALAGAALLAVFAPAAADERICHGQHAMPTPASENDNQLQNYARLRAWFGFRHDIPYIEGLIERGLWDSGSLGLPVTKAEDRYLRLRNRLDLGSAANRYLRRHADVYGGLSIEDDWPQEPYILARFTRDVPAHLAALKRLARFPENLRAKRVRYSERDLRRIERRIEADRPMLERAGFFVFVASPDGALHFEVAVVTRRKDYRAFFARRYGPIVKVRFAGTRLTRLECARADTYAVSPDGLTLTAHWGDSGSVTPERIELTEYPDRVEIGVVQRGPTMVRTADLVSHELAVRLSEPLGARAVIDAGSGRRVPQQGPSPGKRLVGP
jgi:hypothetical protein